MATEAVVGAIEMVTTGSGVEEELEPQPCRISIEVNVTRRNNAIGHNSVNRCGI
jgi:hypothetical protein